MASTEIEALTQALARLPGLGPRSARRAVLHLMKRRETALTPLLRALDPGQRAALGLRDLRQCRHHPIPARSAPTTRRDARLLCVVEEVSDLWALDRSRLFPGRFHVLGGRLSALEGIRPEDLGIDRLVSRVAAGGIDEVVLAMNATLEGQTTAHYLAERLERFPVRITQLAHGLPVGGELDYLDEGHAWPRRSGRGGPSLEESPLSPYFPAMALLPILEVPDPRLRQISTPVEAVDRRDARADRRHVRDDVRGAGHRPRRGPGRRAQAPAGHRPAGARGRGRRAGPRSARLHQPRNPRPIRTRTCPIPKAASRCPSNIAEVDRPDRIRARWLDEQGEAHEEDIEGVLAVVLQHEMDHLEGMLFIDHLSRLKREMILRKIAKAAQGGGLRRLPVIPRRRESRRRRLSPPDPAFAG